MSVQSVIDAGRGFDGGLNIVWLSSPWWVNLPVVILLILAVFSIMLAEFESVLVGIIIIVIVGGVFLISSDFLEDPGIKKWQKEVATPYVNSLPVTKREIVFIKIDPEMTTETYGSNLYGSGYLTTKRIEKTPLTVSFKSNGRVVTRTDWYDTTMTLTKESKPYIEYQYVKHNLGHGFKKGMYNVRVYLPESYEFTDIK